MTPSVPNEMIRASAGCGKTYALAGRIIRVLHTYGADPSRIVALTFSRKAAGEIFDKLISRLAAAAADPVTATALNQDLGIAGLTPESCCQLLRRVIGTMHRTPIGTLDSFCVRILRTFPFEFGVPGDFTILDDRTLALAMPRLLPAVAARRGVEDSY